MYSTANKHRLERFASVASLACLPFAYCDSTLAATTPGLQDLASPTMLVSVAKIDRPYTSQFYFTTDPFKYPSTSGIEQEDEQTSVGGAIIVEEGYGSGFGILNTGLAYSDNSGVFYSSANYVNPYNPDHVGVLSETHWYQSFRKDAADAQFKFTISTARLETKALGADTRAEFTANVNVYSSAGQDIPPPFWSFHQHAGLHGFTLPGGVSLQPLEADGPMLYSESVPDTWTKIVNFDPYTGSVDLSGIAVGEEFTVALEAMTLAQGVGEVARSYAYFRDPLESSGGFQIEISGLTATNNPLISAVPEPSTWVFFLAGVGLLGWVARRRTISFYE